jgi:hypothetical protein
VGAAAAAAGGGVTTERDVDRLLDNFRDYVRALMGQGQIGGHENLTAVQGRLRDAVKRVLGMKVEESAND